MLSLFRAWQHAHNAAKAAHALHLLELLGHIIEIENALGHFLCHALGLGLIHLLASFLNQRNNIALAKNTARQACRIKGIKPVKLFTDTEEFDRQACHRAHRKRCAAAPVAIHAGEHKACQLQALIKALGRLNRILSSQSIGHQQGLGRIRDRGNLCSFAHHLLIERGAPCRIEDQHVMAANLSRLHRAPCNVSGNLPLNDRKCFDIIAELSGQYRKLLHRSRTTHIEAGQQNFLLMLLGKKLGELARRCCFTRALQTRHHHNRWRAINAQVRINRLAAQHLDQTIMDDLDHLLAGFDRTDHILADGFFFDRPNKFFDHRKRHIGLKQRHTYFAQGRRHVLFRERPASGQPVKYAAKAVCQCVEHQLVSFRFAPS